MSFIKTIAFRSLLVLCSGGIHADIIFHVSATDLMLADGAPVSSWGTLSQSSPGAQPTYRATGMNGNPSVDFDGSGDYLTGASMAGVRSLAVVTLYEGNISIATLLSNDNDTLDIRRSATANAYTSTANSANNADFWRHDGSISALDDSYVNGVKAGGFSLGASHVMLSNSDSPASYSNFTVGRAAPSGGAVNRWWDGDVSEIYAFSQALTSDEIVGVSSLLADRWNSSPVSATPAQLSAGRAVLGIVPEPSSLSLLILGMLTCGRRYCRRSSTKNEPA